jgi:hypothetical protein
MVRRMIESCGENSTYRSTIRLGSAGKQFISMVCGRVVHTGSVYLTVTTLL